MFNMHSIYSLKKVLHNSISARFLTKNLTMTALFSIKPDPPHSSGFSFVFYEAGNNVATVLFPINVNITSNKPTFCSTCSSNLRSAAYVVYYYFAFISSTLKPYQSELLTAF